MAKERIGIEIMLQKAYQDWRVERITPASVLGIGLPRPPAVAGAGFMSLGTRIDAPSAPALMAARQAAAASVPDDMVALHDEVLALPDVFACYSGDGLRLLTQSDVREAGGDIARADGHNAWMLHLPSERPVRVRQIVTSMVVIENARLGTRPGWHEEGTKIRPWRWERQGRAEVWEDDGRRFCPIIFDPPPQQLWEARGQYVTWWDALDLLASTSFDMYEALPPDFARCPWDESVRVIHSDCAMPKRERRANR